MIITTNQKISAVMVNIVNITIIFSGENSQTLQNDWNTSKQQINKKTLL